MNKIRVGDNVELNNNAYVVREIYENFLGEKWAVCINIDTKETSDHPISTLNILN